MWKNLACLAVLAGCVPPSTWDTQPTYGPQPQQAQSASAPAPQAGLSCIEIVQCLAGCGQDQACLPACIESGDEAGQIAVDALLACNAAGTGDCGAELDACRGGAQVAAGPAAPADTSLAPGQPHTTADLIPWLTGEWITSNHQFTFFGDGRVRRADAVALTYDNHTSSTSDDRHCVSTFNEDGTVTQDGDLLIMVFETAATNHCGERSTTAGLTVRYRIEWVDNPYYEPGGLQLRLRDIDCTAGDMWCLDSMRRR